MAEGNAFDEMTGSDRNSASSAARPEPSAPLLEEGENLPVATPVSGDPDGGDGSSLSNAPTDTSVSTPEETQQKAAGIAAAVVGFFLGGPFLSLIFGGGTYYAATQRPEGDTAGDAARSLGDVALVVRDRASELDEKHNITDRTKAAAGSLWQKSKAKGEELDAKHGIVDKSNNVMETVVAKAVAFNNEHRVLERARLLLGNLLTFLGNKLSSGSEAQAEQQQLQPTGGPS